LLTITGISNKNSLLFPLPDYFLLSFVAKRIRTSYIFVGFMHKKHKISKITITTLAAASVLVATLMLSVVMPAAIPSAFALGGGGGGCGKGGCGGLAAESQEESDFTGGFGAVGGVGSQGSGGGSGGGSGELRCGLGGGSGQGVGGGGGHFSSSCDN
jgi:hypothetical protein